MIAMPDPRTFAVIPWRPAEKATGRMFCDIRVPGGEPYEGDPRWILRRALKRAEDIGEPKPDEADVAVLDKLQDVVWALGARCFRVGHLFLQSARGEGGTISAPPRCEPEAGRRPYIREKAADGTAMFALLR